jgi:hypothetical protein
MLATDFSNHSLLESVFYLTEHFPTRTGVESESVKAKKHSV